MKLPLLALGVRRGIVRLPLLALLLFPPLATGLWWYAPPEPRAVLPEGSEILRLSPDGRRLAVRQGMQVSFWDVAGAQKAGTIAADLGKWPVWGFAFSPDGRWLAGTGEGVLKLWEVPAGKEHAALPVSTDNNFRVRPVFSSDGKWLAFRAQGPDRAYQVKIWDLSAGQERASLPGRAGPLRFSRDSKWLVFEAREGPEGDRPTEGRIHLWDTATWQEKPWFEKGAAPLRRLAFSPDGRTLATAQQRRAKWEGHHELKLWDLDSGAARGPWQLPHGVSWLAFTPDGSHLLAMSFDKAWELAVIDPAAAPAEIKPTRLGTSVSFALSTDLRLLAHSPNQPDEPARVVELPELHERARLAPQRSGERLFLLDFTRDGQLLAALGSSSSSPRAGRRRRAARNAVSTPDSEQAPELLEGEVHIYETDTGRLQGTVPVARSARVWFTPDARTLVVLAPEGTPTLWDLPLRRPWGHILGWWGLLAGALGLVAWLSWRRQKGARVAAPSSQEDGASIN